METGNIMIVWVIIIRDYKLQLVKAFFINEV